MTNTKCINHNRHVSKKRVKHVQTQGKERSCHQVLLSFRCMPPPLLSQRLSRVRVTQQCKTSDITSHQVNINISPPRFTHLHIETTPAVQYPDSNLEVRNGDGNSLRVAVADADGDLLDTGLLGSGSGGTVKLNEDLPLALLITSIGSRTRGKNLR